MEREDQGTLPNAEQAAGMVKEWHARITARGLTEHDGAYLIAWSIQMILGMDGPAKHTKAVRKQIQDGWEQWVGQSEEQEQWWYATVLGALHLLQEGKPIDAGFVHLAETFAGTGGSVYNRQLRAHHDAVLDMITAYAERAAALPEGGAERALWAQLAAELIDVYFYHTHASNDDDLRTDAALRIPDLLPVCYPYCGNLTHATLAYHPQFAAEMARLIEMYVTMPPHDNEDDYGDLFYDIAYDFAGDSDFGLLKKKKTAVIVECLQPYMAQWTDTQFDFFVDNFVFYGLGDDGVKLVAKSADRQQLLRTLLAQPRSTAACARMEQLLAEAEQLRTASKRDKPQADAAGEAVTFTDFNFKLVVIDELMYNQQVLEPAFHLYTFVDDYLERDINIEEEGYEVIPEALRYFEELVLTTDHLRHVEQLCFDGGASIYGQLYPFWGGEDDTFDVRSVADAVHLPQLKHVTIISMVAPETDLTPLTQRGIAID